MEGLPATRLANSRHRSIILLLIVESYLIIAALLAHMCNFKYSVSVIIRRCSTDAPLRHRTTQDQGTFQISQALTDMKAILVIEIDEDVNIEFPFLINPAMNSKIMLKSTHLKKSHPTNKIEDTGVTPPDDLGVSWRATKLDY